MVGQWQVCTPESVATFSAVGYFFGRELQQTLNRPIGLIGTYWGGQAAQSFTSLSGLQKDPPFTEYVDTYQKIVTDLPAAKQAYPALEATYQDDLKKWNDTVGATYTPLLDAWKKACDVAQAAGQKTPPKPNPSSPQPKEPPAPDGGPRTPTALYNGMIAPLIPYGIKGVIWYQGENNANKGLEYRTLFPRMITDWREKWAEGDFPFLYVQLAGFSRVQTKPSETSGWVLVRESQMKTLSLPNTGMASAVDIGDANNIHPRDKLDVGLRLALLAKDVAYGQQLVDSGPLYDAMKIEGNTIRLTFKSMGGGLQMAAPPWTPTGVPATPPTALNGFAIAGADQNFFWAQAKVDGNSIVVSSDQVPAPVAVRYSWSGNPIGNLYNKEGLPASPFRTDDWPIPVPPLPQPPKPPAPPVPKP